MTRADRPLALTLGDPAGIGPDITLLAFEERFRAPIPPFVLLGDCGVQSFTQYASGVSCRSVISLYGAFSRSQIQPTSTTRSTPAWSLVRKWTSDDTIRSALISVPNF